MKNQNASCCYGSSYAYGSLAFIFSKELEVSSQSRGDSTTLSGSDPNNHPEA